MMGRLQAQAIDKGQRLSSLATSKKVRYHNLFELQWIELHGDVYKTWKLAPLPRINQSIPGMMNQVRCLMIFMRINAAIHLFLKHLIIIKPLLLTYHVSIAIIVIGLCRFLTTNCVICIVHRSSYVFQHFTRKIGTTESMRRPGTKQL